MTNKLNRQNIAGKATLTRRLVRCGGLTRKVIPPHPPCTVARLHGPREAICSPEPGGKIGPPSPSFFIYVFHRFFADNFFLPIFRIFIRRISRDKE
jgi:hypothetical protein